MDQWLDQLRQNLRRAQDQHLLRWLQPVDLSGPYVRIDGQSLLNLASNDYLGLSTHPHLRQAAVQAIQAHGTGAGASRLVAGHLTIHAHVEERFAAFKHAQAALLCPTGYMANLAVLTALAGPGDLVCLDKLSHASLIDAARASGAQVRVFPHLDYAKLEKLLRKGPRAQGLGPREELSRVSGPGSRVKDTVRDSESFDMGHGTRGTGQFSFIVTDSVFSMDGDVANLPALCDLADRFDAILVVDEAHGTGVLGASGAGLAEAQGVADRIDITVSTASKALGGLGGMITARQEVIQTLINRARPFIYTTAVPPAQAAVLDAALDVIRDEPQRRQRVLALTRQLRDELCRLRWPLPPAPPTDLIAPIVPLVVGQPEAALALAAHLRQHGIYAPAIRPPTVPPGSARVRLSLRADLPDTGLDQLLRAVKSFSRG